MAVTLVGYPIVSGFFGETGLAMCACWDLGGIPIAYVVTYALASLYKDESDDTANDVDPALDTETPAPGQRSPVYVGSFIDALDSFCGPIEMAPEISKRNRTSEESQNISSAAGNRVRKSSVELVHSLQAASFAEADSKKTPIVVPVVAAATPRKKSTKEILILLSVILRKVIFLPPVLGFFAGIVMRVCSITVEDFPVYIGAAITNAASCTPVLAMFGLGIFFQPSLFTNRQYIGRLLIVLGVKYTFGLVVGLSFYIVMQKLDVLVFTVLAIALVMPTPPAIIAYAREFGYDEVFAALAVNACLPVSFILAFFIALILGPED